MTHMQEWVERRIAQYERLLADETAYSIQVNLRTKLGELKEVLEEIVASESEEV